ncbi:MAG: ABC transporter substrate-binding protein, partial [Actinomycetota bacterium]|nr:ABC transporter substrate-binding protein [Actinomycetota bacterium]
MRIFIVAAVSVAVSVNWVAPSPAQQPIRVGASLSLSGTYAPFGPTQLHGYQLCIKDTNEKGGVLGRKLGLVVEDDQSQPATAARIYEKLITQDRVEAILGPYGSAIVEAVADVAEKHRMPMVGATGATSSIFKKGRKFVFQVLSPAETYFDGLIDMAAKRGLKTLAVVYEDALFPRASARGAMDLAKKKGLHVVLAEVY